MVLEEYPIITNNFVALVGFILFTCDFLLNIIFITQLITLKNSKQRSKLSFYSLFFL